MRRQSFVIIGASLAGVSAAQTLRNQGFDGRIHLIGAEARLPYSRPPLSKGYLRGQERFEEALLKPEDFYAAHDITLRLGTRATAIDPRRKFVELEGGEPIAYDRLLVTTGGRNRTLSVPGADLDGVGYLRQVEEADRIRAEATAGRRVVVVGLGFTGSEIAASLRQLGVDVTAIDSHRAPLARVLGEEVGAVLGNIHRDMGVKLLLEDGVAALEGADRVERVRTRKGTVVPCDLVVAGIGIVPNTELLAAAGAAVADGVLVDARSRTSLPDVYAAGDVANHWHPLFGRIRVEHWNNAERQGQAAARAMLGDEQPYDYLHSFWSDQYADKIEYVGYARGWDRVVFRGEPERHRFLGFYLEDGAISAAVGLNRGGDPEDPTGEAELKVVGELIRNRRPVDPTDLADERLDLRRLAAVGVSAHVGEGDRGPDRDRGHPGGHRFVTGALAAEREFGPVRGHNLPVEK
jgi:3-phenylpropionate/trans-cinnamate dioxygenase ferredoxin reductase subunit